jgi:gluconokinase
VVDLSIRKTPQRMMTRFFIVMGVSGSGKTSVGRSVAEHLGWDFYDADDFHPPENVSKMASGIPLDDSDRVPWLATLHELISSSLTRNRPGVLACSALKDRYRRQLMEGNPGVQLVYLKGSYDLIWSRMEVRKDHYMKPHMLQSQFGTLESPRMRLQLTYRGQLMKLCKRLSQKCHPERSEGLFRSRDSSVATIARSHPSRCPSGEWQRIHGVML